MLASAGTWGDHPNYLSPWFWVYRAILQKRGIIRMVTGLLSHAIESAICKLLPAALVALLTVQLTGLSCLDKWQTLILTDGLIVSHQASPGDSPDSAAPDDGCPCHLSIISVDTPTLEITYQLFFQHVAAPKAHALIHPSLVLRPPLSL